MSNHLNILSNLTRRLVHQDSVLSGDSILGRLIPPYTFQLTALDEQQLQQAPFLDLFHSFTGIRCLTLPIDLENVSLLANKRSSLLPLNKSRLRQKLYAQTYFSSTQTGVQDVFANSDAWIPTQATQSATGMSAFLSTLMVFTSSLSKDSVIADRFELTLATAGFSVPALLAWHLLVKRRVSSQQISSVLISICI